MSLLVAALIAWFGSFGNVSLVENTLVEEYKVEYIEQQDQEQNVTEFDVAGV